MGTVHVPTKTVGSCMQVGKVQRVIWKASSSRYVGKVYVVTRMVGSGRQVWVSEVGVSSQQETITEYNRNYVQSITTPEINYKPTRGEPQVL